MLVAYDWIEFILKSLIVIVNSLNELPDENLRHWTSLRGQDLDIQILSSLAHANTRAERFEISVLYPSIGVLCHSKRAGRKFHKCLTNRLASLSLHPSFDSIYSVL